MSFSYSFRAGVAFKITDHLDTYIGGYYLKVDDNILVEAPPDEGRGNALNMAAHVTLETSGMILGLRYYF